MSASLTLAYVKKNPGVTCAEVAKALRLPCGIAGACLRTLRAEKRVKSRGNTRGTRYYAAR